MKEHAFDLYFAFIKSTHVTLVCGHSFKDGALVSQVVCAPIRLHNMCNDSLPMSWYIFEMEFAPLSADPMNAHMDKRRDSIFTHTYYFLTCCIVGAGKGGEETFSSKPREKTSQSQEVFIFIT